LQFSASNHFFNWSAKAACSDRIRLNTETKPHSLEFIA